MIQQLISFFEFSDDGELIPVTTETYNTEKDARNRFIQAVSYSFNPASKTAILWEECLPNNKRKPMGKFIISAL